MFDRIFRTLKKQADARLRTRRFRPNAEGRVVVNMTVKDDDDFLSVFSESDTPVISSDVAEFIENSTCALPPLQPLTLHVKSNCIDEREQVEYAEAIREYYTERYAAAEKELRRNMRIVFSLGLAGVLTLAAAILIEYRFGSLIWSEVIDIVAWVLLWEAVDIFVFQNRALRRDRMRYLSYISMKIEYEPIPADIPARVER